MKIELYSDGSATVPSKPGGWGYVLVINGNKSEENSGYHPNASNNDMELEAAIQGLTAVLKYVVNNTHPSLNSEDGPEVFLCSDSQLVLGWADGSFRFKQESKMEKYRQLQYLVKRLKVKTRWIKGHSGNIFNERCDHLANVARKQLVAKPIDKPKNLVDTCIGIKRSGVICVWYNDTLKVIDLEANIVENYNRDIHGKRGSALEIRGEKSR